MDKQKSKFTQAEISAARRVFNAYMRNDSFNRFEEFLAWEIRNGFADSVNPMKNGLPVETIREHHIARDLVLLSECDAIYVLPCHTDSTGAKIEICFAIEKGITVLNQFDLAE